MNYTFSGFNYTPTFPDLMFQVGVARILFSADYPYGSRSSPPFRPAPGKPGGQGTDSHGNAERLLRM